MTNITSEQLLSNLERSKEPSVQLLDDAFNVLGLQKSSQTTTFIVSSSPSKSENPNFRGQWVLRWLIKRLNQELDAYTRRNEKAGGLVADTRTWILLQHLLESTPPAILREILVERHFAEILGYCLERQDESGSGKFDGSRSVVSTGHADSRNGRPAKKRRLSNDSLTSQPSIIQLHLNVLNVTARVLGPNPGDRDSVSIPARWTESVEGANRVLNQILNYADRSLESFSRESSDLASQVLRSTEQWVELWTNLKSTKSQKQNLYVLFNESLLKSVLHVLQHKSKFPDAAIFRNLERIAAINTVLPLREAFQSARKALWKTASNELSDLEVKSMVEQITRPLGNGITSVIGDEGKYSRLILSIAGRIVPRTDVVRRKAESVWFEWLYYTLHVVSTSVPGSMSGDRNGGEKAITQLWNRSDGVVVSLCKPLLDVFASFDIEPSSAIWRFHVAKVLANRRANLDSLPQVIFLNPTIFISSQVEGKDHLLQLLNAQVGDIPESGRDPFISQIIIPVLNSFGKARRLPSFVDFWTQNLNTEALAQTVRKPTQDSLWDNPRLLQAFEDVCIQYTPLPFCDKFIKDLTTLTDNHFSTNRYANVVLGVPLLKALRQSVPGREILANHADGIHINVHALIKDAAASNQGWRLWALMNEILKIESLKIKMSMWPALDSFQGHGGNKHFSDLMKYYHVFCSCATIYERHPDQFQDRFVDNLLSLVKLFQKSQSPLDSSMIKSGTAWNGMALDMTSVWKMISTCLIRIARTPLSWISHLPKAREVVLWIVEISCIRDHDDETSSASLGGLASAAEANLSRMQKLPNIDMVELYLESHARLGQPSEQAMLRRVPSFLRVLASQKLKKHRAQKLQSAMLDLLCGDRLSNQEYLDCLWVLQMLVVNCPILLGTDWDRFFEGLAKSPTDFDLRQCIAVSDVVGRICEVHLMQAQANAYSDKSKALIGLLSWTRAKLESIATSKNKKLFKHIRGFVLLTIVSQCRSVLGTAPDEKFNEDIQIQAESLRKLFEDHAADFAENCIKKSPDATQCFLAWKLSETLPRVSSDGAPRSASETMEKINRRIHDLLPKESTDESLKSFKSGEVEYLASQVTGHDRSHATKATMDNLAAPGRATPASSDNSQREDGKNVVEEVSDDLVRLLVASPRAESAQSHLKRVESYLALADFIVNLSARQLAESPEIIPGLGRLACLESAVAENDAQLLMFRLDISKMILDKHSQVVNQHVIDSTLRTLTLLTSSASKICVISDRNDPEPGHIFDRLCTIMSLLLIRYRRRLSGRYHLVLPVLQNLLKCLFYPPSRNALTTTSATYASKAALLDSLPCWLNPRDHTSAVTLPPSAAARLSRILQTICDPSASSARHTLKRKQTTQDKSTQNLGLVDETKVLRQQVSQHMQYLIQTYCQATLDGYIAPEVREKLIPGMYAVVGATDIEILRGVNAGMNESQRAIWKDVYADWRSGGKWNQR